MRTDEKIDPKVYCQIAVEEALGLCKDPEYAFAEIAALIGVNSVDLIAIQPIDIKYASIIDDTPEGDDIGAIQIWVLCKAYSLYRDEDMGIRESVLTAWEIARREILGE
jgi:hypothetical protein